MEYEFYRELFRITEWRDGTVYKTESLGYGWFDEATIKANRPLETSLIYSVPSTKVQAEIGSGIRRKRN